MYLRFATIDTVTGSGYSSFIPQSSEGKIQTAGWRIYYTANVTNVTMHHDDPPPLSQNLTIQLENPATVVYVVHSHNLEKSIILK